MGNKGNTLANPGKHYEAIKAYNKATEIKPQDAAVWYNKGRSSSFSMALQKTMLFCQGQGSGIAATAYDETIRLGSKLRRDPMQKL